MKMLLTHLLRRHMAETIEIKKTRVADGIYLCQSDILILISKMKETAMSLECRTKLQNLLEIIADASNEEIIST